MGALADLPHHGTNRIGHARMFWQNHLAAEASADRAVVGRSRRAKPDDRDRETGRKGDNTFVV